jgi:hypothetical protein
MYLYVYITGSESVKLHVHACTNDEHSLYRRHQLRSIVNWAEQHDGCKDKESGDFIWRHNS